MPLTIQKEKKKEHVDYIKIRGQQKSSFINYE